MALHAPSERRPTVLLTGFEPFDGHVVNASWEAVQAVDVEALAPVARVAVARLPVVFGRSLRALRQAIRDHQPDLVICVGQAGRSTVSLERIAINVNDARIPDNDGAQPIDLPIVQSGPAGYWSTLPVKAIVESLRAHDLPAAVSQTAGTYVCNHVFYGLMRSLKRLPGVRGGFVHVPPLPQQADDARVTDSLALDRQARALELIVRVSLEVVDDRVITGGALH